MDRPRSTVSLKEFVEHVVGRIIDHPEELQVEVIEGDRAIVIETRVAPIDAGRVIGREGRTINALRTLVMAMAARTGKRAMLDVVEIPRVDAAERSERHERPERSERPERPERPERSER